MQATHRSGPLKQKNKPHHTLGHRSNRNVKKRFDGKSSKLQSLVKKSKGVEWRNERKNREKDLKKQKRLNAFNLKRSLGQLYNSPYVVTILYFCDDLKPLNKSKLVLDLLKNCNDEDTTVHETPTGSIILTSSRFKLRFQFLLPNINELFECMDAAKITDVLLYVYDANKENLIEELKQSSNNVFNGIYNHCLPTCLHVLHGLNDLPIKKQSSSKKTFQKQLNSIFPEEKLHFLETKQDALQLLNLIGNCKKKSISYRERRSQLLADKLEFIDEGTGKLRAYGYVRNKNLDANKIIHIPGLADFEISRIEVLNDPYKITKSKSNENEEMQTSPNRFYVRDEFKCQTLENYLDEDEEFEDNDQELPTAEEIAKAEEEYLKKKKLVPKGTSDYQAAWLVDSDEEDLDDEENSEDEYFSSGETNNLVNYEHEDNESIISNNESNYDDMQSVVESEREIDDYKYDEKMDLNEEMKTLEKIKEEKFDQQYPDEIDTPLNLPAKLRFAKYRGLASFNKTTWDPNENLPKEYSKLYEFQNYKRSRKLTFEAQEFADGPCAGEYVMVELLNFSKETYNKLLRESKFFLFYQLLKHEQKMSLMNVVLKKHSSCTLPVKSKERLIFHVGCRRYSVCPIFSQHTNGNKFKYEKFLRSDTQLVASFFAPITFNPCSVTVYKQLKNGGEHHLVATGSVLDNRPSRIIVKRLILSGYPFKIHKTFSVIRYMFFNRDDILWFKPIELRTKYGRKGTIKEPLGTHGHMKCVFDRVIKSNDTVLMNLYKRVFPKWTYEPDLNVFNILNYDTLEKDSKELADLNLDKVKVDNELIGEENEI